MTNKELHEEINYLKTKLAKLEEKIVALPKRADGGIFKPKNGQEYWCILASGEVYRLVWNYNTTDHDRYVIGNCFPTEQAAEDFVRAAKLIQRARETQNGFAPDWDNWTQNKYIVYCNRGVLCVRMYCHLNLAPTLGYWKDKSMCEKFINENYDELIWFFTEYRR